MCSANFLSSAPPSLSEQLKQRTEETRLKIIRSNNGTQFAQTALELAEFRDAIAAGVDTMDDDALSASFRKTVRMTTYESYAPLMAKFFEIPCKASAVINLLAPGIPDHLVTSSATSGGVSKSFPKYNYLSKIKSSDTGSRALSDPLRRRTRAYLGHISWHSMHIEGEKNYPVATLYLTVVSTLFIRKDLHLHPDEDKEKMSTFLFDHTAPYATAFIKNWRSFLFIHALFSAGSRSLESIDVLFISTFLALMQHLDSEYDMVVDCIEKGTIPDLDGIAEVRHYLDVNISPDPKRAAELRNIGPPSSQPGWCALVWPNLRTITGVSTGSFATYIPLVRRFLGPNIVIVGGGYGTSEAGTIAVPCNHHQANQFKPVSEEVIEFLDISKDESVDAISQLWEVKLGRQYEIVITTQDGLWRYRQGDVFEIAGFDPADGVPIIQFIERLNVALRFPGFVISEGELRTAISSMAAIMLPVQVVDWTTTIDDRCQPFAIEFFVEFSGDLVTSDLARAADEIFGELSRNDNFALAIKSQSCRKPTVQAVRSGTFDEFRRLKVDENGSTNLLQVKVPVVLPKPEYVTWFSSRVT